LKPGKYFYLALFSAGAFVLWGLNLIVASWLNVSTDKVSLMTAFLWLLFLFFSFFYRKIKDNSAGNFILWYVLLLGVKFILALAGAFLFLDRDSEMVKQEALFYLFDYFILSMFNVFLKVES